MWKFTLREVFLVVTVLSIAMAVNVWSNRELRVQLEEANEYTFEIERYSEHLHRTLRSAKGDHDDRNQQIATWLSSGELRLKPDIDGQCGCGPVAPNWAMLSYPKPSR